jgi:small subunit ribosomal protein S17
MQDEEKKAADPQADQPVAEDSAEEQAPEEAPAAEAPAEEAPAEEAPAEEAPAEEAPAAEAAEEPAEQLSPKQRRKASRSRASGEARPQRSVEERAAERVEVRRRKAAARSRWRGKQREKQAGDRASKAAAVPDEAPAREPGKRKVRQGVVVSSKADKTITVRIDMIRRHRVYGKVVRESGTLHAHDETNQAGEGDVVRLVESRPLSRTKRWRLVEILEKAR